MPKATHKTVQRVVYVDESGPEQNNAAAPPSNVLRAYIADMVGQLARMAQEGGDTTLANELNLALLRSTQIT